MRPTQRMLYLATAWTLTGLAASIWQGLMPVWIAFGALLLVAAISDLISLPRVKHFKIERTLPGRFALSVPAEVTLSIQHRLRRSLQVAIIDGLPAVGEAPALPWHGKLPAGNPTLLSYDLHFTRRGRHQLSSAEILASSALQLWQRRLKVGATDETRCYPNYEPVVRYALLATSHREEQMGIVKRRRSGAPGVSPTARISGR